MKYVIYYYIPGKKYDYTEFAEWKDAAAFLKKCQDNVDSGMTFEIMRSVE